MPDQDALDLFDLLDAAGMASTLASAPAEVPRSQPMGGKSEPAEWAPDLCKSSNWYKMLKKLRVAVREGTPDGAIVFVFVPVGSMDALGFKRRRPVGDADGDSDED